MLPISGLYEVAIRVKSLPRAEAFYRDILGLEVAIRDPKRPMLFLRVGGDAAMIVLQEDPGEFPKLHFAFTIAEIGVPKLPPTRRGVRSSAVVQELSAATGAQVPGRLRSLR